MRPTYALPLDLRSEIPYPQADYATPATLVVRAFAGDDADHVLQLLGLLPTPPSNPWCAHCGWSSLAVNRHQQVLQHMSRAHSGLNKKESA